MKERKKSGKKGDKKAAKRAANGKVTKTDIRILKRSVRETKISCVIKGTALGAEV